MIDQSDDYDDDENPSHSSDNPAFSVLPQDGVKIFNQNSDDVDADVNSSFLRSTSTCLNTVKPCKILQQVANICLIAHFVANIVIFIIINIGLLIITTISTPNT